MMLVGNYGDQRCLEAMQHDCPQTPNKTQKTKKKKNPSHTALNQVIHLQLLQVNRHTNGLF